MLPKAEVRDRQRPFGPPDHIASHVSFWIGWVLTCRKLPTPGGRDCVRNCNGAKHTGVKLHDHRAGVFDVKTTHSRAFSGVYSFDVAAEVAEQINVVDQVDEGWLAACLFVPSDIEILARLQKPKLSVDRD